MNADSRRFRFGFIRVCLCASVVLLLLSGCMVKEFVLVKYAPAAEPARVDSDLGDRQIPDEIIEELIDGRGKETD